MKESLNNCICYGPIKFYRRRKKAPTLLTGRRSRFDQVCQEEQIKRELRREKNRFLSKQLKEKREKILNELIQQIKQLEQKQFYLVNYIQQLLLYQKNLYQKLEKQDPLINLIQQYQIPLFFEQYQHSNEDIDSFISTFNT